MFFAGRIFWLGLRSGNMKSFERLSRRGVKAVYDASSSWIRHMFACSVEFPRGTTALHVLRHDHENFKHLAPKGSSSAVCGQRELNAETHTAERNIRGFWLSRDVFITLHNAIQLRPAAKTLAVPRQQRGVLINSRLNFGYERQWTQIPRVGPIKDAVQPR